MPSGNTSSFCIYSFLVKCILHDVFMRIHAMCLLFFTHLYISNAKISLLFKHTLLKKLKIDVHLPKKFINLASLALRLLFDSKFSHFTMWYQLKKLMNKIFKTMLLWTSKSTLAQQKTFILVRKFLFKIQILFAPLHSYLSIEAF